VVGDFDGDLVIDLAYEQERDVSNSAPLAVLFGKSGAIPSDLLEVPAQGTIQDLASAYLAEDPDAMNDLVTVAAGAGTNPSISAILGRSDRFLHSTLRVTDPRQTPPLPRFVSAVVAGRFIQTSPWNLVVISDPTRGGTTSALSLLASGRDLGQVLASIDLPSEPSGFVRLAAVDLDLDGVDELILVAYPNSNQISIVKPGAAMPAIAVVYSGSNGETFEASSVATNDVDGDGRPDLTVSATLDGRDVLEIFYNDGSGTLHPAARRAIALPRDTSPRFAWINVDSDAAKELAIVGGDTIVIAEIDRQSQGFTERLRLPAPITTPSSSVVSGDFDGDGIDDLACNGTGLQIYWGKAARSSP